MSLGQNFTVFKKTERYNTGTTCGAIGSIPPVCLQMGIGYHLSGDR